MVKAATVEKDDDSNVTVMPPQKIAVYNEFRGQLAELKQANSVTVFDYESKDGNKAARSYIFKLRKTKAAVDEARKKEKAASLEYGRRVDTEADEIKSQIEEMIQVHQKAVDEIEEREKTRIADIRRSIDHIKAVGTGIIGDQTQPLVLCLRELEEKIVIGDFYAEFKAEAYEARDQALAKLKAAMAEQERLAAERAENDRMRRELEEYQRKERDDKIRKEAEEKARLEAEAKAQAERVAAEQKLAVEKKRADDERLAAEKRELELKLETERAEKAKLEAEAREKAAIDQAERDRLLAIENAKAEKLAAEKREEQARIDAIAAEQLRVEREAKAKADADAKRAADENHKAEVNARIITALMAVGVDDVVASDVINAIAAGKVPYVSIRY